MQTGQSLAFAPNVAKAKVGALSVFDLMDRTSEIDASRDEGAKPEPVIGEVTVSNVEFKYPSRPDISILKGLNLDVKKSQTIGLVGTSGCGKSTVIQLCERFYDVDAGTFRLDAQESKVWNVTYLRRQMALVGQEPVLFDMSIAENISYGLEDTRVVTQEEIEAAARDANIHEFIVSLPDGYKTRVGERGLGLSGGQKQRVAIGRINLLLSSILRARFRLNLFFFPLENQLALSFEHRNFFSSMKLHRLWIRKASVLFKKLSIEPHKVAQPLLLLIGMSLLTRC
jgi:ABC-type multidrug transport system fused ATPase/permease subunit